MNPFMQQNPGKIGARSLQYSQERFNSLGEIRHLFLDKKNRMKSAFLFRLTIEALRRITQSVGKLLGFNKDKSPSNLKDKLLNRGLNKIKNRHKTKGATNVIRSLSNRSRGLGRKLFTKGATTAKITKNTRSLVNAANKAGKVAQTARTAKNGMGLVRAANNAGRVAKAAHTAKKLHTVAKIGQAARVGMLLRGGVALAGGPVGIGLFAASVAAPYVIGAVWKNREKIYEASKDTVELSKLKYKEVTELIKAKQGKQGDVIPEAKNLKIADTEGNILFEGDAKGKILTNNINPEHKLTFYQEEEQTGAKSIFAEEPDNITPEISQIQPEKTLVSNTITTPIEVSEKVIPEDINRETIGKEAITLAADTPVVQENNDMSAYQVILNSLNSVQQNNRHNREATAKIDSLKQSLQTAKQNSAVNSKLPTTNLNQAGNSLIQLFNQQSKDGKTLETQDYNLTRRGKDYFLQDKSGNHLLTATDGGLLGVGISNVNLNPKQIEDLKYLSQDLKLDRGITGGFDLAKSQNVAKEIANNPATQTPETKPEQSSQNIF